MQILSTAPRFSQRLHGLWIEFMSFRPDSVPPFTSNQSIAPWTPPMCCRSASSCQIRACAVGVRAGRGGAWRRRARFGVRAFWRARWLCGRQRGVRSKMGWDEGGRHVMGLDRMRLDRMGQDGIAWDRMGFDETQNGAEA